MSNKQTNFSTSNNIMRILDADLQINKNILNKVTFRDQNIEKLYVASSNRSLLYIKGDQVIVIGWISIFLYVYFEYYRFFSLVSCTLCLLFSLLLITAKRFIDSKYESTMNNILALTISFYLNLKIYYLIYLENYYDESNGGEILRTAFFDYIAANLLSLIHLNENNYMQCLLLLLNQSAYMSGILLCKSNIINFMDSLISIFYYYIFYVIKKTWEYNSRCVFAKNYSLENLLNYSNNFVNELNCIHITKSKADTLISGKNLIETIGNYIEVDKNSIEKMKDFIILDNSKINHQGILQSMQLYNNDKNEEFKSLGDKVQIYQPDLVNYYNFKFMGIFFTIVLENVRYFQVFYRKYNLTEFNIIDEFFYYDITDHIKSQIKIKEEYVVKQKLYAKISHEFKTPINSILGLLEIIKESIIEDDTKAVMNHLQTVKNLSSYVIYLTNDIIQYSQAFELKSIKISSEFISLRNIIQNVYEILICLIKTANKDKNIQPILIYDDKLDDIAIISDEIRIKQILLNFISNAVKFTKSGKIIIEAKLIRKDGMVNIEVSDSGVGIPVEEQKKIFDENLMIHNSDVENRFGTGLGLAICNNLAKILGFNTSFSSTYGVGSKFRLEVKYRPPKFNGFQQTNKERNEKHYSDLPSIESFTNIKKRSNSLTSMIETDKLIMFKRVEKKCNSILKNIHVSPRAIRLFYHDLVKENGPCFSSNNFNLHLVKESSPSFSSNNFNFLQIERPFSSSTEFYHYKKNPKKKSKFVTLQKMVEYSGSELDDDEESEFLKDTIKISNLELIRDFSLTNIFKKTPHKVLIVDDNVFITKSVKNIVEQVLNQHNLNYEVIFGSDGIDILNFIREDQKNGNLIKCIITDENMEYLNGSEAIKLIREFEKQGKVKFVNVITSTCHDDQINCKNIIDCGSNIKLSKPLTLTDLKHAFEKLKII